MKNKNTFLGIALIIIGIAWTLSNLYIINGHWVLPFIGIILLIIYQYRGGTQQKETIGFLIAGCIIFMIGIFAAINDLFYLGFLEGPLFFFFLGAAFLPVYALHTRHFPQKESGKHKWPIYTGFILIAFGLFILLVETFKIPEVQKIYPILWPVVLILLGLYIIFGKVKKK